MSKKKKTKKQKAENIVQDIFIVEYLGEIEACFTDGETAKKFIEKFVKLGLGSREALEIRSFGLDEYKLSVELGQRKFQVLYWESDTWKAYEFLGPNKPVDLEHDLADAWEWVGIAINKKDAVKQAQKAYGIKKT